MTAADRFAAFIRRLCETQAYAMAGDAEAQQVVNEYGLARWSGHPPEDALAIAEHAVAAAEGGVR